MKKHFLLHLSLIVFFCHASLAQVPNSSFENWVNYVIPSLESWVSVGNTQRSNDAYSGNYSIRMDNNVENNTSGLIAKANLSENLSGGEPYADIPNVISFYAKYNLALGDQGHFIAIFKKDGQDIGSYNGSFEGHTSDTFVQFREAISWETNITPDTIIIIITSKNFEAEVVNGDGYLIIDNIKLENFGDPSQDIKNNGFENWEETLIPHPEGWYTTDIYLFENVGIVPPLPFVSLSSDAFSGSKALLLRNRQFGNDIIPGIAFTDGFHAFEQPTFRIDKRWEYFSGKYKYNSTLDSANVMVRLFKNGFPVGFGLTTIPPAQDENYKTFGFRLNYTVQTTPDSASIVIACANGDHPKGANTTLILDDLAFVDDLIGIDKWNDLSLTPYPNPTTGVVHFSENVDKVEIWNMFGQKMMTFENVQTIDITALTNQMYLIKTENNNQIWIQKISKQ